VIMARTTISDAIMIKANEFAKFRVWGTNNNVSGSDNNNPPSDITMSVYNASVVSVDIPDQMAQGDIFTATITMNNTGIANWYADGSSTVHLGAVGGISKDAYRFAHEISFPMAIGSIVRKGETYAFLFNIVAPAPGQYLLEFQMTGNESGGFGEIACRIITVVTIPTSTPSPTLVPTIAPTSTPTYPPYMSYVAYGKFVLYDKTGNQMVGGPWYWIYNGPFGLNNLRSSYFSEPSWPFPDWDIGGPNGQYYIYKDGCTGSGSFSMANGGNKGTIIFRII
jgi:hypothetical protein